MVKTKLITIEILPIHIFLAFFCKILIQNFFQEQEALRALWSASFPGQELQSLISDQWKEMGWQGRDPSTDFRLYLCLSSYHPLLIFLCCFCSWHVHFFWTNFVNRGAGFISLENLLFFAKTFSVRFWTISWWHHFNLRLPN